MDIPSQNSPGGCLRPHRNGVMLPTCARVIAEYAKDCAPCSSSLAATNALMFSHAMHPSKLPPRIYNYIYYNYTIIITSLARKLKHGTPPIAALISSSREIVRFEP